MKSKLFALVLIFSLLMCGCGGGGGGSTGNSVEDSNPPAPPAENKPVWPAVLLGNLDGRSELVAPENSTSKLPRQDPDYQNCPLLRLYGKWIDAGTMSIKINADRPIKHSCDLYLLVRNAPSAIITHVPGPDNLNDGDDLRQRPNSPAVDQTCSLKQMDGCPNSGAGFLFQPESKDLGTFVLENVTDKTEVTFFLDIHSPEDQYFTVSTSSVPSNSVPSDSAEADASEDN